MRNVFASTVPRRTFNVHGIFALHKSIVEIDSLDFLKMFFILRENGTVLWGTKIGTFKKTFWNLYFFNMKSSVGSKGCLQKVPPNFLKHHLYHLC